MNQNEIKSRLTKIEKELADSPEDASLLNDLGVGHFLLGEYEQSISYLKRATTIESSAAYHFNLGNAFTENQDYEAAMESYMDALELEPSHIGALNNLADLYETSGDPDKAHELFHYIMHINPEDPVSHYNLGNFFLRQNQHIEAAKCFEEAIKRDETFTEAYYNIAWILYKAKAYEESLKYANKGLNFDQDDEMLLELKGQLTQQ